MTFEFFIFGRLFFVFGECLSPLIIRWILATLTFPQRPDAGLDVRSLINFSWMSSETFILLDGSVNNFLFFINTWCSEASSCSSAPTFLSLHAVNLFRFYFYLISFYFYTLGVLFCIYYCRYFYCLYFDSARRWKWITKEHLARCGNEIIPFWLSRASSETSRVIEEI